MHLEDTLIRFSIHRAYYHIYFTRNIMNLRVRSWFCEESHCMSMRKERSENRAVVEMADTTNYRSHKIFHIWKIPQETFLFYFLLDCSFLIVENNSRKSEHKDANICLVLTVVAILILLLWRSIKKKERRWEKMRHINGQSLALLQNFSSCIEINTYILLKYFPFPSYRESPLDKTISFLCREETHRALSLWFLISYFRWFY